MTRGAEPATPGMSSTARVGSSELPLFPLNTVLFPGGPLPLRIFEPRYVDMVRDCMRDSVAFGVVLIRSGKEVGAVTSAADVGTSARIIDFNSLPDGLLGITCIGEQKFRVESRRVQADGLNIGTVTWLPAEREEALRPEHEHLGKLLRGVLPQLGDLYQALPAHFDEAKWVGSRLAEILPISLSDRQACLELDDPFARIERLAPLIRVAED